MRSHADIIREAGGAHRVRERLGLKPKQFETVKSWFVRDNIPAEYWRGFVDCNFCTADELMTAAHVRRQRQERAA
jgi:hypothetical protein